MDRDDFARQFQANYARLWLIAASLVGDRTEAEDIVQEAAVIAFRKRDTFAAGTSFSAWATRIVRLCAANHRRKSTGRRTLAIDPATLDQLPQSGEWRREDVSGLSDSQSAFDDAMLRALRQLTPDARACLLLRVVDEQSYAEIAETLGIPEGTAMSHVHRSRKQLRAGLRTPKGGVHE